MSDLTAPPRIRAEASVADPHSMRFVLDRDVQKGAMATFSDAAAAQGAPLAEALFAIAGVKMVDVSGAVVAVIKTDDSDWSALKRPIADALRTVMAQSAAALGLGAKTFGQARTDAEIRAAVQEVLDRQANPSIASHGGHVSVTDVADGVVSMLMSGGCQGCASSAATLRGGVERMIRAAIPEVRDIIDVTDHAAGETPFYSVDAGDAQQPKRPLLYRPVPPDAILREDDQFFISPDYLAPRLGMDPETLRAGLLSGEVVSQSEVGAGADAGKTRLIIRSSRRVWAAEISADGAAHEVPAPRAATAAAAAGSMLRDRIRAHLAGLSAADVPLTYGTLARAMGLHAPGSIAKVTQALEATMVEDAGNRAPFLASLVVSKVGQGYVAKGFLEQARALGRGPGVGEDDQVYHQREFIGAVAMLTGAPQ
ncbi:MAG: Fe-S cluster biogenesis protein NfuA [Paracoccaceae bacterium]|jgi:Fe-S cluster biogenesis protein NfuA